MTDKPDRTSPVTPPCGHPKCVRPPDDDTFLLAKALGFEEQQPGVQVYSTNDPEEAIRIIKAMTGGVEEMVADVVAQAEEIAKRANEVAEKMRPDESLSQELLLRKGGRVRARKIGRRKFWEGVRQWWNARQK